MTANVKTKEASSAAAAALSSLSRGLSPTAMDRARPQQLSLPLPSTNVTAMALSALAGSTSSSSKSTSSKNQMGGTPGSAASRPSSVRGSNMVAHCDDEDDGSNERSVNGPRKPRHWSEEEDDALRKAVDSLGEKQWKNIALWVPGRNHTQCLQRWSKVLTPGLRKGQWDSDEDDNLVSKVLEQAGVGSREELMHAHPMPRVRWGLIQKYIIGRTAKQCRERWTNHLNPDIKKGFWSPQEDEQIQHWYRQQPRRWAWIAKHIPGRTENAVKIRWKSLNDAQNRAINGMAPLTKKQQQPRESNSNSYNLNTRRRVTSPNNAENGLASLAQQHDGLTELGKRRNAAAAAAAGGGGGGASSSTSASSKKRRQNNNNNDDSMHISSGVSPKLGLTSDGFPHNLIANTSNSSSPSGSLTFPLPIGTSPTAAAGSSSALDVLHMLVASRAKQQQNGGSVSAAVSPANSSAGGSVSDGGGNASDDALNANYMKMFAQYLALANEQQEQQQQQQKMQHLLALMSAQQRQQVLPQLAAAAAAQPDSQLFQQELLEQFRVAGAQEKADGGGGYGDEDSAVSALQTLSSPTAATAAIAAGDAAMAAAALADDDDDDMTDDDAGKKKTKARMAKA